MIKLIESFLIGALLVGAAAVPAGARSYHVTKHYQLGGEGFWDCLSLDPTTGRLFITRGSHVMLVDPRNGKVAKPLPAATSPSTSPRARASPRRAPTATW